MTHTKIECKKCKPTKVIEGLTEGQARHNYEEHTRAKHKEDKK